MHAEFQSRRHAEVAPSTAKPPEELGVLIRTGRHNPSAGSDDLGADEVVACQTELRGQVADPAAERETGHPGRADDAPGRDEAEGLRRRVEVEPRRAPLR